MQIETGERRNVGGGRPPLAAARTRATWQLSLRRAPRRSAVDWARIGALYSALGACTLLADDIVPVSVDAVPGAGTTADATLEGSGATASGGDAGACAGAEGCCTTDDACDPSERCVAGACVTTSCIGAEDVRACELAIEPRGCSDGLSDGTEAGLVCGRDCPERCPAFAPCRDELDCASLRCERERCAEATCEDGVRNQDERDIDCGGDCAPCAAGAACVDDVECESGICDADGACAAASCEDGIRNQAETAVDCGGTCEGCALASACTVGEDCESGVCSGAGCEPGVEACCQAPSCNDGVANGGSPPARESDIDCGGTSRACARCPDGGRCRRNADCASSVCNAGVCAPGQQCRFDRDCPSGACQAGRCCGGDQENCTRCAERLSPSLNCDSPGGGIDRAGVANCSASLQCLIDNPGACPTRTAPGCAGNDESAVCNDNDFGGTAGTGVSRAVQVLENAGCQL